MSVVWSRDVTIVHLSEVKNVKTHAIIKWCLSCCPFYGGCPHLGGSVKGGSTVLRVLQSQTTT